MNLILDLLFPKKCVGCNKIGSHFCSDCIQNIAQTDLVCPKCERPAVGGETHPICKRKFGLDGLWSLGVYQDPLRSAIKKLKYRRVSDFAPVLVDIMIEYWAKFQPFLLDEIKKNQGKDWMVVPVPLHWRRENDRGFNQSGLIGELFAKKLGLKYGEVLKRTKFTKSQAQLKGKERAQNIRDAFIHDSKFMIHNSSIILIDDVWTTGSTIRECCYVLKRNGVKKVWALTLAR